jgi:hypothetical protein
MAATLTSVRYRRETFETSRRSVTWPLEPPFPALPVSRSSQLAALFVPWSPPEIQRAIPGTAVASPFRIEINIAKRTTRKAAPEGPLSTTKKSYTPRSLTCNSTGRRVALPPKTRLSALNRAAPDCSTSAFMLVLPIPAAIQGTVSYGVILIGDLFDANHLYLLFSHVSYISGILE